MSLIDADAINKYLKDNGLKRDIYVDTAPTVDSVVHCKDCYFSKVDDKREPKYKCTNICRDGCTQLVASDDYCSYGALPSEMDKNTEREDNK